MINQIKELRVKIDGLAQSTKELHKPKEGLKNPNNWRVFHPTETEKAVDSLYLAKAWLGKVLGELGNENPYGSGYKTKEDIVPTQDVNQDIHGYNLDVVHFEDKNHIEKIDWLREEIKKIANTVIEFNELTNIIAMSHRVTGTQLRCIDTCWNHLIEARFWLGFELGRIKNT